MVRTVRWSLVALLAALPVTAPAAQQAAPIAPGSAPSAAPVATPATSATAALAGPRLEASRAGIVAPASTIGVAETAQPAPQNPALRRRGVPQMIIGGAALIGGAIIGDDAGAIISIAGLGIGLWGLWLYLQ